MSLKISPLAPKTVLELPPIAGVRLGSVEAGIKYKKRKDLTAILFDTPAEVAGVFTRSKCPSAAVDWCRKQLARGKARAVVVNSGNANAFTGTKGSQSVRMTAEAASSAFGCNKREVFIASTGVIGEPLDVSTFDRHLSTLCGEAKENGWAETARAIMTTDTYPKLATSAFDANGKRYVLNGIAKGAGMIQPDMATMLSFLVTDMPIAAPVLQKLLGKAVRDSFNAISVDSDTSTSDTLLLFSAANGAKTIKHAADKHLKGFKKALKQVLHDLAMAVVRDGEGATKHVEITVSGASSNRSAKRIAFSIANSPLVKTAIAGQDANWGRIVMAVGKAGEPADRDRLSIWFGENRVAHRGERDLSYNEEATTKVMQGEFVPVRVELGIGKGRATVWTCDLTSEYVAINGDYRS